MIFEVAADEAGNSKGAKAGTSGKASEWYTRSAKGGGDNVPVQRNKSGSAGSDMQSGPAPKAGQGSADVAQKPASGKITRIT